MYVYIYIQREREREREREIIVYVCVCAYMCMYMYIYIYIYTYYYTLYKYSILCLQKALLRSSLQGDSGTSAADIGAVHLGCLRHEVCSVSVAKPRLGQWGLYDMVRP